LHKARDAGSGIWELSPVDPDVIIRVNDFDAAAVADPSLTAIKDGLLAKVREIAIAQGKI